MLTCTLPGGDQWCAVLPVRQFFLEMRNCRFLVAAVGGMLVSILYFYHVSLVCRNETTIEALRDITFIEDNVTFDLGKWNNFTEVFGENLCCWLFPVRSGRGNGYEFHVNNFIA
jgi:hypothetical protein